MTSFPFFVPKYQRGYAWEEDEVNDFISDVREMANAEPNIDSHFMGGIVHAALPATNVVSREHEIVDGQQRMATVTLAIAAANHDGANAGSFVPKIDSARLPDRLKIAGTFQTSLGETDV